MIFAPRIILRRLSATDAVQMKEAIDESLEHLRPFVPWAFEHPAPLDRLRADLARSADDFSKGKAFRYGVFARQNDELLGGVGLYPLNRWDAFELGYWLRQGATGKGYATEAASAASEAAFTLPGLLRLELHVLSRNERSKRLALRLGFEFLGTRAARGGGEGETVLLVKRRAPVNPLERLRIMSHVVL